MGGAHERHRQQTDALHGLVTWQWNFSSGAPIQDGKLDQVLVKLAGAGWILWRRGSILRSVRSPAQYHPFGYLQGKSLDWCMEKREELGESSVEKVGVFGSHLLGFLNLFYCFRW